jgi:hypothetical protein
MGLIKGIQIKLFERVKSGSKDPFGNPISKVSETGKTIDNVLVYPTQMEDLEAVESLTGRRSEYTLAIPKGNEDLWEGGEVEFFGRRWRVIGSPTQGIEDLIPLDWNAKVYVEQYE